MCAVDRDELARWLCEYRFGERAWAKASDVRRVDQHTRRQEGAS